MCAIVSVLSGVVDEGEEGLRARDRQRFALQVRGLDDTHERIPGSFIKLKRSTCKCSLLRYRRSDRRRKSGAKSQSPRSEQ
jgi:hypothetical protein